MATISRISPDFADWRGLLSLIMSAFAYMDALIDPPSSAHRLTPESLKQKAKDETCFLAMDGEALIGCLFCKPEQPNFLYVGKLAVSAAARGQGIGRALLEAAEREAKTLGIPALRLETRVELTENHRRFESYGFHKTADRSHPGYNRVTFIEMVKPLQEPVTV